MDGFIKYMKREVIWHNIFAALYAVTCFANMVVGLQVGIPIGVLSWALSYWMGYLAYQEAQRSRMSAKILDQARLQQREMEE